MVLTSTGDGMFLVESLAELLAVLAPTGLVDKRVSCDDHCSAAGHSVNSFCLVRPYQWCIKSLRYKAIVPNPIIVDRLSRIVIGVVYNKHVNGIIMQLPSKV